MKKVQKSRVDLACNACWVIVFTLLTFGFHVSTVEAQQIRIGSGVHFVNSTTVVVKGDSLVNRGTLKNGAHGVIELTGNLKNHGTFTNETGSIITLDGTNPQTIGGSVPTTFNTLNLGNSAGVTLAKDATVNGSLNFQTGILTTGSNLLTIAETGAIGNAAATRYVDGKLAHIFNEADTKIFPIGKDGNYRPVVLQLFTLTGTSLVTAEQFESGLTGTLPSDVTLTTTNRKWTITQSGGSDMQYFVRLDATGYTPERPVVMLKKDAGLITSHETTTPDYTNTGAFTSFSDFGLGEECVNPTGGGTIEGEQTICTDESPTELTGDIPPDFIGTLEYQWQVSITSSTEEFSIIDDTDSQDYTPTSVTQTSWFKRLSRVDCKTDWTGAAESNVVEITVNQPVRRYVTMYGAGLKDGSSWDNAYDKTQLQDAINEFCVNEVWVAAGTYLPTLEVGGTGSRYRSFQMKNGVAIYGGFASNEASDYDLSLRNFATNETILSGDLDRNDNFNSASGGYQITTGDDNCYHVFCHPSTMTPVLTNTAVLDGFTISGGNANGIPTNDVFDYGGGIYNYGCSPTIRNTIFKNNAAFFGGGLYNEYSSNPTITRTDFINNYAHQDGGGIYNWESSSPVISEVTISNNYGIRYGGGLCNHSFCNPAITNVTINNNTAWDGGGIYNRYYSAPTFTNVLISNNLAYYAGDNGWGGGVSNEYNSAPVFTNTTISNNTVVNGFGGGVYNYSSSTATFNNSIIWGNNATITSNGGNQFYLEPETSSALFYSCYADGSGNVVGNLSASNSTTLDPQFVNSGNGDFRLWTTSPCLDEGSDGYNNENCDIRGIGFERKLLKTDHTLTGTIDMGAYEYKEGTDPLGCGNPTNGGIIASNQTVCLGSIPLEIESTSLPSGHTGDIEFQWQESTASAITGFSNITGANDTTFQAGTLFDTTWFRRLARVSCKSDWTGCDTSNVVKITIEPTPVSGTLAKTPNQTTVCEGDNVSAALTAGSGGSSVDSTYYRTKTSSGWSSWANYASGTNITTTGKTEVEVQTKRKGTECDDASWTTVSWTIEQTPVSGTLAKAPNQTTVCEGDNVSAALTAGSGGSSVDSTYYRTKTSSGWSSWVNYVSGTNITTSGKTEVEVHTKRKGAECDDATWTTVSWTVEQTPVSGTLAKTPNQATVCEGDNVSAALTAGSGGSSVDSTYYRTKTSSGWSSWTNYVSGTNITTTGKTEVEIHTKRKGSECDDANWTAVTWTVEPTPVSGTLAKTPNQATVCEGENVSAALTAGSGGSSVDSTYYRTKTSSGWSSWTNYVLGTNITTTGKTEVEIHSKRKGSECDDANWTAVTWTVEPTPVSGTLAKAPNQTTVCEGDNVSAALTAGSGGSSVDSTYYRTKTSSGWSSWANYASGTNITTNGKTEVEVQTKRKGAECEDASWTTVSWTVEQTPVSGTLAKAPNQTTVCEGDNVSAALTSGSGGSSVDSTYFRTNNGTIWSSWTNYVSGTNITTTGKTEVEIHTKRKGSECDDANWTAVTWTVEPTPVSGTLAKTPSQTTVCEGDNVSAALTAGSGGSSVDSTYYRTKTSSGWSSWANYASGTNITTTGKTEVEVHTKRKGAACDDATWTTVSWTVEQTPVSGTLAKSPDVTNVCEGDNVSAALTAGSGGSSVDSTYYRTKTITGWSSWANYASGTNITTTGKTEVEVHTKRKGAECDDATWTTVSWTVEQTPVSGTLVKIPDQAIVCEGDGVSASLTVGSGGNGTDSTYYRTNNGNSWSDWAAYTSGSNISTSGKTFVEIQTKRKADFCNDAGFNTISWSVQAIPVAFAGNNATLVMGESYTLSEATAENEDSISWSTDGDGSFDDRTAINATYTPGSEDISSGDLQLCINVEPLSPCLLQASDCMKITILRNPTISITSPVDGSSVYTNPVTISGTAADADGNLSLIQVKLNSGIWKTATGTDIWTIDLNLNPGKNTILARAKDASDLYSDTATIKVLLSIQIINIPKGWSAISSYLTPINPGLQVMMNEITNNNNLVIMLSENGVYWPSQNYNTIGNWNVEQGYKVKMNIAREFTVRGDSLTSRSLDLSEGYHIIPVLSNVACPITSVFIDPLNDIFFMYDVRTNALYWPRGEIFSLTTLLPGKGYIASFNKAVTLTYPAYSGLKTGIITNNTEPELDGPWALVRTGDVHFISIKNEALKKLENASFMGAFDSFGNCIGYTEVDRRGGNYLLSVYGNDAYTDAKDGAEEAEPISFRSFSSSTQTETELIAEYNASFPNDDGLFASNGQSSIINFKESSTGIGEAGIAVDVLIYPNPAKDELNIAIKGFRTLQGFGTLMSAEGKLVKTFVLTGNQTQLNVQDLQPGVYMLRIENAENVVIKRVVIQ